MSNKAIFTPNAPAAIGPYSQAVQAGNTVYVSGQLPIDPATGAFAGEDIASQTRQSLTNMKAILEEAKITDDCSAIENMGMSVKIVEGDERNIKITTPLDLKMAELIWEEMQ